MTLGASAWSALCGGYAEGMEIQHMRDPRTPQLSDLQLALEAALRDGLPTDSIRQLEEAADRIDNMLCTFLESVVLAHPDLLLRGAHHNSVRNAIQRGRSLYRPRVRESAIEPGVVDVALVGTTGRGRARHSAPTEVVLEGRGRLHTARLWLPRGARIDEDQLTRLIGGLFRTGYCWFEEAIRKLVERPELSIGRALYSYLRPHLADALLAQVWFGCGHGERGVFLLDPRFGMGVLDLVEREAREAGESPLRLLLAFIGCDIPIQKTFGTIAIAQTECLDFALGEAKYRDDLPLLVRTQIAMCGSDGISVFPIHRDASGYLIMSFPTRVKTSVLPVLEVHRSNLVRIFKDERRLLKRFLREIDRRGAANVLEALGRIIGTTGGAFIKELGRV